MARYVLILFAVAAVGCQKLREGVVREIAFPEHEPALAITAKITEGDSVVWAVVYRSAGVLDSAGSVPAEDAVVAVRWGGVEQWAWSGSNGTLEAAPGAGWTWQTGEEVVLEAEAPGLPLATAQATVPPPAEGTAALVLGADTVTSVWTEDVLIEDRYAVDVVNHAGVHDRYLIAVEQRTGLGMWTALWAEPDLASAERLDFNLYAGGFLVDDLGLDQTPLSNFTFTLTRWTDDPVSPDDFRVRVASLSDALYQHYVSLADYSASADNPFAEPASVFGNIAGGYGIFGLQREQVLPW